jgi:hypothetical protein
VSSCREVLRSMGRMKFLRPLYRALGKAKGGGREYALDTFAAGN